jgi:hypothetical protein
MSFFHHQSLRMPFFTSLNIMASRGIPTVFMHQQRISLVLEGWVLLLLILARGT